ncbi:unnamed protein product [Linum trigynum]|uniref:Uncharacterized protein n=1 Tax=Linum trigynum TaxID=586398 RepID=A0AAV2FPJ5_9ROSI
MLSHAYFEILSVRGGSVFNVGVTSSYWFPGVMVAVFLVGHQPILLCILWLGDSFLLSSPWWASMVMDWVFGAQVELHSCPSGRKVVGFGGYD